MISLLLAVCTLLPNPKLTPGVADPHVTVQQLFSPAFIKARRNVPDAEKRQVYAEYGITSHKLGEYEVDHLISLELGGTNDLANLWPQSYAGQWNAHMKDRLENELHRRVQAGRMTLPAAQQAIAHDWIATYKVVFPGDSTSVGLQPNADPDNSP